MRRLDGWHVGWMALLIVGVVSLGITFCIAIYNRENSTFANFAGIWGLFVGLIGFVLTIYTVFETQRVSRAAQEAIQRAAREAQEAVKNAQDQTRQMLERVRNGMRAADFSTLYMWTRELRSAAMLGNWHRALVLAEECPRVAEHLANAEGIEDEERQALRERADDLRLVHAYITKNLLTTETKGLPVNHAKNVEKLAALLERIGGRLHYETTKGAIP